jgi:hypothetical protein
MVARNDVTGDKIQTRDTLSKQGEENFDKIFGKKKKTNGGWTPPPLDWNEDRIDTIGQNGNDGDHYNHLGCYAYPNCDLDPLGCSLETDKPETYGHK